MEYFQEQKEKFKFYNIPKTIASIVSFLNSEFWNMESCIPTFASDFASDSRNSYSAINN